MVMMVTKGSLHRRGCPHYMLCVSGAARDSRARATRSSVSTRRPNYHLPLLLTHSIFITSSHLTVMPPKTSDSAPTGNAVPATTRGLSPDHRSSPLPLFLSFASPTTHRTIAHQQSFSPQSMNVSPSPYATLPSMQSPTLRNGLREPTPRRQARWASSASSKLRRDSR
jgi:hypothetical protein